MDSPCENRFSPTDAELILDHLKEEILDSSCADLIETIDVYSKSPDQLPLKQPGEWYAFTTRPNGNHNGNVLTDDGYYSVSMDEKVYDNNDVIGFMRTLVFYQGRPPTAKKTNWIIHEFRANPAIFAASELDASTQEKISSFVLCRIILTQLGSKKFPKDH